MRKISIALFALMIGFSSLALAETCNCGKGKDGAKECTCKECKCEKCNVKGEKK